MTIQDALSEVGSISDALGMPVDAGIRQVVAALLMHDIPTNSSCEGHLERGEPYPWVGVGSGFDPPEYKDTVDDPVAMKVAANLQGIVKDADGIELYASLYRADADKRYGISVSEDSCKLRSLDDDLDEQAIRRANYATATKLTDLLSDYYRKYPQTDYELQLTLKPESTFGDVSLINNGAAASCGLPIRLKKTRLQEFQAEMIAFAEYLAKVA